MTQERILIVEDEKVTALEIAEHLRQLGYQPLGPCAYGKEAVTSALALHPDVVLMDITLKGPMDGIQAAEAIRSTWRCPVIYVTAHADQATLDRAKVTEPFGYVLKPISQRELHIAIQIGLYRHGLEGKLKESEERYRTAIESSNDGVVIAREGRYVYVNQRFLDLFGYDGPEEVLGIPLADARHVHPEDRKKIAETVRQTQAEAVTASRYDSRAMHKDGRVLHVEASTTGIVYQGEPASLSYLRDITERKQAELRLSESEEAMKSLLNATNDIALLIDTDGTIIAANTVLAQRLGTEVNKLIGRNIFDLFPEDIAHGRRLWAEKVVETGKPARFEDKSLHERYFDSCVYPVLNAEGKVVRLAVFAKDITEAKHASRALAESDARFKQLFDSVNDGISVRDARTYELVDANRRYCEMWDYTLEELKALPRGALAVNESAEERRKRLEAHCGQTAKGAPHCLQLKGRRKDGSTFWVEMNVERLALGGMDCLLTVSRDITERRKAEEALENSETRLQQLFDNINDGITVLDGHTFEILDLNQRVCQIYGYTQEEFRSVPLGSFSSEGPDYGRRTLIAHYERAMTGEPELFERQVRRKDGRLVWVEMNLKKVSLGGRDCVLSVIRDISERKWAELALRESEERYRTVVEASADGIAIVKEDRHVYVNRSFLEMHGYARPEEIIGASIAEASHLHAEDRDTLARIEQEKKKGMSMPLRQNVRIARKDGSIRYGEASVTGIVYQGGPATLVYLRDITERKQAEAAIADALETNRAVVENSPVGIVIYKAAGQCIAANAAAANILGTTVDRLKQQNFCHIESWKQSGLYELAQQALSTGQTTKAEVEIATTFGSHLWLNNILTPFWSAGELHLMAMCDDFTKRKQAEHLLKASEERYRALFESSHDAIMTLEPPSWRFTSANPAAFQLFGANDQAELLSLNPWELSPEWQPDGCASAEAAKGKTDQALRDGFHSFEWTHGRVHGDDFLADVLLTRMEQEGKITLQATVRDITERKRAEERIRKVNRIQSALLGPGTLHEKLKRITDGVVEIFAADFARAWLMRPGDRCEAGCVHAQVMEGSPTCRDREQCLHLMASSGRYTHLDGKAHARVPFGCYKIGRIASGEESAFLTNDFVNDSQVHDRAWAKALGLASFAGYQLRPPDGQTIGVLALFSKHPISSEEDALLKSFSNLIVPVIQTIKAEETMRESESRYRALVETTFDWVWEVDTEWRYTFVSAKVRELLGYAPDEVLGRTPFDLMPEAEAQRVGALLAGIAAERKPFAALENINQHRDGHLVVMETSGVPILAPDGSHQGYQGMDRDIAERKMLQAQLLQAQKLESIGQLAAGIAHEINTPTQYVGDNIHFLKDAFAGMITLTGKYKELLDTVKAGKVTKGIVDEIEETMEKTDIAYLSEEIPKAIQQSMEGVERVTGIVRAMKEFSHPGTKEKEPIDINRAIENTLMVSRNAWKYVADVVTEFDPSLPLVPCLPGEFNQVILNIIVNAAQAIAEKDGTSAEKGNIAVSTFNRDGWAEISISDNGPGIPEEIRSRIFDPFFTTKEVGKGTGQGLAIARSIIVDKHHGEITLDTVPGEGTTFTIRLPMGEGA